MFKKLLCLTTTLALALCFTGCSNSKKNLFSKEIKESIPYYNDNNNTNYAYEYGFVTDYTKYNDSFSLDKYIISEETTTSKTFTSILTGKEIASVLLDDLDDSTIYCPAKISYLTIEYDEDGIPSSALYDFLGNEIVPKTVNATISISSTTINEYSNAVGDFEGQYIETITTSIYDNATKETTTTVERKVAVLSRMNPTPSEKGSLTLERKDFEEYYQQYGKAGDSYGNFGKSKSASNYLYTLSGKMKNYFLMYNGNNTISIYNKKHELVNTIATPAEESGIKWGIMGEYMIKQEIQTLDDDADEYDYYDDDDEKKMKIFTYSINLKNGKIKRIKDFNYLICDPIYALDIAQGTDTINTIALYSLIREIKNKVLAGDVEMRYFDSKGNILSDNMTNDAFDIRKLDDKHYIGYDHNGACWIYNEDLEKAICLGFGFEIAAGGKAIAVQQMASPSAFDDDKIAKMRSFSDESKYGIIDYDGNVLVPFDTVTNNDDDYNGIRLVSDYSFLVTNQLGSKLYTFADGALTDTKENINYFNDYSFTYSSSSAASYIFNGGLFVEIEESEEIAKTYKIYNLNNTLLVTLVDVVQIDLATYANDTVLHGYPYLDVHYDDDSEEYYLFNFGGEQ